MAAVKANVDASIGRLNLVRPLFPETVLCAEISPLVDDLPIHPLESAYLAHAGLKRKREFVSGRWLAASLLGQLGLGGSPVLMGSDRAPIWPNGVVGSISHSDDSCVVVLAMSRDHRSLAVDIEPMTPIEPELWESICTPREMDWLRLQGDADRGVLCRLLFSAKECIYKYQYPLTKTFLEFHDVEVRCDLVTGSFEGDDVRLLSSPTPASRFHGRFHLRDGTIVTAMH